MVIRYTRRSLPLKDLNKVKEMLFVLQTYTTLWSTLNLSDHYFLAIIANKLNTYGDSALITRADWSKLVGMRLKLEKSYVKEA